MNYIKMVRMILCFTITLQHLMNDLNTSVQYNLTVLVYDIYYNIYIYIYIYVTTVDMTQRIQNNVDIYCIFE